MNTEQILELISHISVIVASVVAILGVSAWKREFKGKRDIELAEYVLCLFYRAERAIEAIRYWLSFGEGQTREPQQGETPEEKKARDSAWIVFKRIEDHSDIFDQLYTFRFRFMVRFGRDRAEPFDKMRRIVREISYSAGCLADLWAERLRRGDQTREGVEEEIKKHQAVIYAGHGGKPDQIALRVKSLIEEIEGVCRPIIEGKKTMWCRLWG
jgi:hypothetical protein